MQRIYETLDAEMDEKAYEELMAKKRARREACRKRGMTCITPPPTYSEQERANEEALRKQEEYLRRMELSERIRSDEENRDVKESANHGKPRNSEGNDLKESDISSRIAKIIADRSKSTKIMKMLLRKVKDDKKVDIYYAWKSRRTKKICEIAGMTEEEFLEEISPDVPVLGTYQQPHSPPRKHRDSRNHREARHTPYDSSRRDGSRYDERRRSSSSRSRTDHQDDDDEGVFEMTVARHLVGRIIGKHGSRLRWIRERSGAKCHVIDDEMGEPKVICSGGLIEAEFARFLVKTSMGSLPHTLPFEPFGLSNSSKVPENRRKYSPDYYKNHPLIGKTHNNA